MMAESSSAPPGFDQALASFLAGNSGRVASFAHQGQRYWVKQQEHLSLRMRLQKGNAARAFDAEYQALRMLHHAGAPVPAIVAAGPGYFVTADSGDTLRALLQNPDLPVAGQVQAFAAAGRALAKLHGQNFSHGRPAIKDICWRDGQITLLDFERYSPRRNTPRGHMQDLVIFLFSALTERQGNSEPLAAAIESYRADDPDHIWQRAERFCKRMRWVSWATWPIRIRRPGKSLEFKAIPMVLDLFAGRPVPEGITRFPPQSATGTQSVNTR